MITKKHSFVEFIDYSKNDKKKKKAKKVDTKDSNDYWEDSSSPPGSDGSLCHANRKRKKQVKQACAGCKRAHTRCEETRPCPRCNTLGIECISAPRKKRKRKDGFQDDEYVPDVQEADESTLTNKKQRKQKQEIITKQQIQEQSESDQEQEIDQTDSLSTSPSRNESNLPNDEVILEINEQETQDVQQNSHLSYPSYVVSETTYQMYSSSFTSSIAMGLTGPRRDTTLSALYYGGVKPLVPNVQLQQYPSFEYEELYKQRMRDYLKDWL